MSVLDYMYQVAIKCPSKQKFVDIMIGHITTSPDQLSTLFEFFKLERGINKEVFIQTLAKYYYSLAKERRALRLEIKMEQAEINIDNLIKSILQ